MDDHTTFLTLALLVGKDLDNKETISFQFILDSIGQKRARIHLLRVTKADTQPTALLNIGKKIAAMRIGELETPEHPCIGSNGFGNKLIDCYLQEGCR